MALLFVCLVLQLLFLLPSTNAAENDSCISNDYEELRRALRDNDTNNIQTLLTAFYRPNTQDIQVANITYCISDNKTFCSNEDRRNYFEYTWASSALLFLQEYELINALVFDLFQVNYATVLLIISPPFCDDVYENDKLNNLRLLTTWLKHYAHSDDNNELQDYAAYFNTTTNTIDIEVYHIKDLQWSLLTLQYVAIATIFITLLLRIIWPNSFANEIDMKLDKISKSFSLSRISNFIKGMKEDIDDSNQSNRSKASQKKSFEYTTSYFLLLVGFIVWDSIQYGQSIKLQLRNFTDWYHFFPIPYIAPIVIGVSFVISVVWSGILLCCHSQNICTTLSLQASSQSHDSPTCTCRIRDLIHFPILTGLGVFFVFHGIWMLLMLSTYATIVIVRSLFIAPLFCFVMALLPRLIKALCNSYIHSHYKKEWYKHLKSCMEECMKCKKYDECHEKCKKCKKCKTCINCNNKTENNPNSPNSHYECKKCIKCDTCKKLKKCDHESENKCDECKMCTCDQFQRCIHCKECTLCEDCKNCKKCKQCHTCKLSNCFKLCIDCMNERKERNCKNFTAIYGFFMIVANAIPLLLVLHYGSNYILVVTDLNENLATLLIALAVIVGVPYYLILLWDSGNDNNDGKANPTNQQLPNDGEQQDALYPI